jgi:L-seryl-tRNA(Ser) seleniumtransferase
VTGDRSLAGGGERGAIYRRLGVEPIINGRSTFTILGGSLMPPVVLEAMRQAAECFVDLLELQAAVGHRLAELTRNESAYVSGGAAAGLFQNPAAAMKPGNDDGVLRFDDRSSLPREFLIHRAHRIPYDLAINLAGGTLTEFGGPDRTSRSELDAVITPRTAAVLYVDKAHLAEYVLPLETVVEIARPLGVPVIVDAAAQLPPVDNLWRYTAAGADAALFSGGKGLCGPASTSLIVGRADFVGRLGVNAAPLQRLGRPMKVGKEDLIGLLTAVEWYLGRDHAAEAERLERIVEAFVGWGRGRDDIEVVRVPYGEAGQPTPRAWIRLRGAGAARRDALLAGLRSAPPRIDLLADDEGNGFYVAPETLIEGEERTIIERIGGLLTEPRPADRTPAGTA